MAYGPKRLAAVLGLILVFCAGSAGAEGIGTWLTSPGKAAAALLADALSDAPDFVIGVGEIKLSGLDRITLENVTFSDADGVWGSAPTVRIRWQPGRLLDKRVHFDDLDIPALTISRLPAGGESESGPLELAWPRPGIEIVIKSVRATVTAPGSTTPLKVSGAAEFTKGVLKADLAVAEEGPESATVLIDVREDDSAIAADIDVKTAPGQPLARILGIGAMGGSLQLKGSGSPEDWRGAIGFALPEGDRLAGTIGRVADPKGAIRFRFSGTAALTAPGLLHADVPSELGGELAGTYTATGDFVFAGPVLDHIALSFAGARADVDLGFAPKAAPDTLALDLVVKDPAVLAPVFGGLLFREARLKGDFGLSGPTVFDGDISFAEVKSGDITLAALDGRLHVDFPDLAKPAPRIALTGRGTASDISIPGAGQPLRLARADWQTSGVWPDGGSIISLDKVTVEAPSLHITAKATIAAETGDLDAAGNLVLDDLSLVRPELRQGRYAGSFRLVDNADGFGFDLDGRVDGIETTEPPITALAGEGTLTLSFKQPRQVAAAASPPGQLTAVLKAPALDLQARASFAAEDAVDARLTAIVTDAGTVSTALGVELARSSRVEARLSGALASPDIDLRANLPALGAKPAGLTAVKLRVVLKDSVAAPAGRITLSATAATGAISGHVTVTSPDPGHIAVPELVLDTSLARLQGSLVYDRAGDLLTGRIAGESEDIATIQETLDVEGSGRFALDLAFATVAGRQSVALTVSGHDISTVLADRQAVTMDEINVTGTVRLPAGLRSMGEPQALELKSHLNQLRAGALTLDQVTFTADGETETFPYELKASGDFFGAVDVTSTGSVGFKGKGYDVVISTLEGMLADRALRLGTPVTYRKQPGSRTMSPLALTYGDGHIDVSYDADRDDQLLRVEIEETDAGLVPLFAPIPPITGALDVRLLLEVKEGKASGYAAVAARNIRPRLREDENFPVDAALSLELDGDTILVSGRAAGPTLSADLSADIPARVDPARARLKLSKTAPIAATVAWNGVLTPLIAVLPPMDHGFAGSLAGAVKVTGTLGEPVFNGNLRLEDGAYENFAFGSRFVDLAGEVVFDGRTVSLTRLTGADLNGGRLSGEGSFVLDAAQHYPGALTLTLDKLRPVALDAATATASGTLTYDRVPALSTLMGDLETQRVELRLVDKLPTEIDTLEVIEVNGVSNGNGNGHVAPAPIPVSGQQAERPLLEALDVTVSSPARVFLRGRGLDSEWQGALHVTGTPAAPRVTGALELVRGTFAFAGRQLDLTEGRLQFTGGAHIDPHLELTGVYDTVSLTAQVQLVGPLSAPEVILSSTPSLPRDEIMARILFGTSVHELSAVEAVQLASAVSNLSGGGGLDVFSKARSMLGLDRLTVEGGEEATDGRLVTGGKYLTNNIYLEVQTRTDTGESNAAVRVDLTKSLQVESDVGSDNSSRIGLRWKKDY